MNEPEHVYTPIIKKSANFEWTKLQLKRAEQVQKIVEDLADWMPLTLRQVFYQLITRDQLPNTRSAYNGLSKLLKHMRIDGHLEWGAIEDATRTTKRIQCYMNWQEFIEIKKFYFLKYFNRDLSQNQSNYIELWFEKTALSRIFQDATQPYCIPTLSTRGFASVTALRDFYNRAETAKQNGQTPVILFCSDLDPSGIEMFHSIKNILINDFHLNGVKYKRIALTPKQVKSFDLPKSIDAIKEGDKRAPAFIKKYGNTAIELDALHPKQLQKIVQDAIENQLDMNQLNEEMEKEKQDQKNIEILKTDVSNFISDWFTEVEFRA
jgi:hypothetical protein